MEISVVIPSYNRRDCVLALLADLARQEGIEFEVIVVDDASPDGSAAAITEAFPEVRLLVNETNGGPCVSRNRGIRAARADVIVGFDSDVTLPDEHLLARAFDTFIRRPEVSGLAFRLLGPDGITEDAPRWWHPLPIGGFAHRSFETSYFSGTAYAFRRAAVIEAGLFPEVYYMHYEEVELAWRVMQLGGMLLHHPGLPVSHHADPASRRSEIKVFYKPRNQVLLALRCHPPGRGLAYLAPRLAGGFLRALRGGSTRDWWRAMRSAASLAPRCLRERRPLARRVWQRVRALKKVGRRADSQPPLPPLETIETANQVPE